MAELFEFKRHAGRLEVEVDTDGSIEIDYTSNARGYLSNDSRHSLAADEVKQIVAALPVASVRVDDPPTCQIPSAEQVLRTLLFVAEGDPALRATHPDHEGKGDRR